MVPTSVFASGLIQHAAVACAGLGLVFAVALVFVVRRSPAPCAGRRVAIHFERPLAIAALSLGAGVACVQGIFLVGRLLVAAIDLSRGSPCLAGVEWAFGPVGLWSLGLVFAAGLVAFGAYGDGRLGTCLLWCAFLIATGVWLRSPVLRQLPSRSYEPTGNTLFLAASWAVVVAAAVAVDGWVAGRRSRAAPRHHAGRAKVAGATFPGLPLSVVGIGTALLLLTAYHFAVPSRLAAGGYRAGAVLATGSAGVAAMACFSLLRRVWSRGLAEAALGLGTLAFCGAATTAIPSEPHDLTRRYPLLFSAMIIGLALSTVLWATVAASLSEATAEGSRHSSARLRPYAHRFAFLSASLALLLGLCLAIWPRRPTVSVADDSLGRVAAGLACNLFLLLVLLWCSRRLKSVPFHILTVLALLSAVGFIVVRMLPFTPRFG